MHVLSDIQWNDVIALGIIAVLLCLETILRPEN